MGGTVQDIRGRVWLAIFHITILLSAHEEKADCYPILDHILFTAHNMHIM